MIDETVMKITFFPRYKAELLRRGMTESDITRICSCFNASNEMFNHNTKMLYLYLTGRTFYYCPYIPLQTLKTERD